jgi:hypothetical protein
MEIVSLDNRTIRPDMKHIIYDKARHIQIYARYFGDGVWVTGNIGDIKISNTLYKLEEFFAFLLEIKQCRRSDDN